VVRASSLQSKYGAAAAGADEELVEEVMLRFPPDDPASLARAALASKQWCRLITSGGGRGFGRRFREFHRLSPPLLGFLTNRFDAGCRFVPAPSSSFRPPNADRHGLRAVHSAHGRVLLHHARWWDQQEGLLVAWDPITDEQRELPPMAPHPSPRSWNAAVLCACAAGGDCCCDHLDCHGDPFLVVFVGGVDRGKAFSCVYSSETGAWSEPIHAQGSYSFELGNSVLLGSALYFKTSKSGALRYDLLTKEMSLIRLPSAKGAQTQRTVLMATEDGRLGFAMVHELKNRLDLWSREPDEGRGERWLRSLRCSLRRSASALQVHMFDHFFSYFHIELVFIS
jgi:hypothetical protein